MGKKKTQFTDEQKSILEIDQGSRIISAQAGAGKTTVMVADILKRINHPDPKQRVGLDQMLVVTFTRKSAGDMRAKINQGLLDALSEEGVDRDWVLTQLTNLPGANIQTLDAFCLETIRAYYDRLGLDPGIHILDAKLLGRIHEEVMDELWDDCAEKALHDSDWAEFLEAYGYQRRFYRDFLEKNMGLIIQAMECQPDPQAWLDRQQAILDSGNWTRIRDLAYDQGVKEKIRFLLDDSRAIEEEFNQLAEMPEGISGQIQGDIARLRRLVTGKEDPVDGDLVDQWTYGDFFPGQDASLSYPLDRLLYAGVKKAGPEAEKVKDDFKESRQKWRETVEEINQIRPWMTEESLDKDFQSMARIFPFFQKIIRTYMEKMGERKRELNGVTFYDCQLLMLKLLDSKETRQEIQDHYKLIYFDEYQDSSRIQDEIINRVSRGDNLFFVGDIKQSIYGFRQAEPENFKNRYRSYQEEDSRTHALDLTKNFRSEAELLAFINFIFDQLMVEKRGGVDYATPTHQAHPGRKSQGEGEVHLSILLKDKDEEVDETDYLDNYGNQPFYVAHEIMDYVRKGGKFSDCVILTRTNDAILQYEFILNYLHIPTAAESNQSRQDDLEVEIAKALLQVIDNKKNDLALLTVLSSHLGGFSDDDLARLRMGQEEGSFEQAMMASIESRLKSLKDQQAGDLDPADPDHLNPNIGGGSLDQDQALADRVWKFLKNLDAWRMRVKEVPLDEFVRLVLEETGLLSYCGGLPGGEERVRKLNQLIHLAKLYSEDEEADLPGFLTYLDQDEGGGGEAFNPGSPLSEKDNVVRVMTIHKAKGLEFPVVFLVDCQRRFNYPFKRNPIISNPDLGTALEIREFVPEGDGERMVRHKSLFHQVLEKKQEEKERSEAIRLLYVAMTRAEKSLYLVGEMDKKKAKNLGEESDTDLEEALDDQNNYLDWMVEIIRRSPLADKAQFVEDFDLNDWEKMKNTEKAPRGSWTDQVEIVLADGTPFRSTPVWNRPGLGKELGEVRLHKLEETFNHAKKPRVSVKKTVSELSAKNQNKDKNLKEWPFFTRSRDENQVEDVENKLKKKNLGQSLEEGVKIPLFMQDHVAFSPAEWGSLMHKAMQLLDFKDYQPEELGLALDRLVARGQFTKEERMALDEGEILEFFKSPLGQEVIKKKDKLVREKAFTMIYKEGELSYYVDGQVDLCLVEEDRLTLVDFKTDRVIRPGRYRTQLSFYAEALERAYKKPVDRALIYWVQHGKVSRLDLDPEICKYDQRFKPN